ncbi:MULTISPECIES: hypothetical protein [Streptomyces]|nr:MULTISPECIES: hypothetical protein [Streptomyces]
MKPSVTTVTHDRERTAPRTTAPAASAGTGRHRADGPRRDADLMAIASFVSGLVGLLVFNVVLGPCALALGVTALARGTDRRFRALLGCALGCADLVLLLVLSLAQGTPSWHLNA